MAVVYAVGEFTDDLGTDWEIKIVDGSISTGDLNYPFNVGSDGFRINYGYDNFDRVKPILGSKLSFTLYEPLVNRAQFEALYTALDTAAEGTYRVEVYRDPDGANEAWWVGEILPEQTVIPDEYDNPAISITAVDGIGNLKGIDYNDAGVPYEGTDLLTAHLYKALSKVHCNNFWASGDTKIRFLEDFIADQYKTLIGVGTNKQLDNAKVEHVTFYNPDSNGVNQYYSAYEVLESIATSLNATIFMAQGTFWLLPMGNMQSHLSPNFGMNRFNSISGAGVVTYATTDNLAYINFFGDGSNSFFSKLKGWERSSVPAFKEVTRTRNYQGDVPVLSTGYYNIPRVSNSSGLGAILADEDALQPEGREYVLSGTFQFGTTGISSLTGQDGVVRARLKFMVHVGDAGGTERYIRTTEVFDANSTTNVVWYGETATQGLPARQPQYQEMGWSAVDTSTLAWYSEIFNGANGKTSYPNGSQFYIGEDFSQPLPPIPDWASGVNIQIALDFVDWNGVVITSVDFLSPTQNYSTWKITNLNLRVLDGEEVAEFGEYDIHAINPDTARYKFDQSTSLIGDKVGEASLGTILINEGTSGGGLGYVDATYWNNLQETSATNYSINGLGVRERLAANKSARRTERGTLARIGADFLHPYTILINTYDSNNYYQLTGLNFIASRSEYDVEIMKLSRNITGITEAIDNHSPSKGDSPNIVGPYNPVTSKAPVDDTIQEANVVKLLNVTTDAYGITSLKSSTGSTTVTVALPDSKASSGVNVIGIDTAGQLDPIADGASGTFLTTDGAGALSWAAAGGGGGFFGSTTTIKVMPSDFIVNDDAAGAQVVVEDDTSGYLGVRMTSRVVELYAFIVIPVGFKATHVQIYTSANRSNAVEVYSFSHSTGAIVQKGIGDFNTLIDITDIDSTTDIDIVIKVLPSSAVTNIYGGKIAIATI